MKEIYDDEKLTEIWHKGIPFRVTREGKTYVAVCKGLDLATQGETIEELRKMIKDIVRCFWEDDDALKEYKNHPKCLICGNPYVNAVDPITKKNEQKLLETILQMYWRF